MLKEDKMVNGGASGCTNWADKNSNIIISCNNNVVSMLLAYDSIFRILPYLMPEAYSKPCQTIMKYTKNPGLVRTVYSTIFRRVQGYPAIFSHVKAYWGTKAYWGIFRHYLGICSHTQSY